MSELVQLQWRDKANNETEFRVFRNSTPEFLLTDTEVARVEWSGTTWTTTIQESNISNLSLETSNSSPSTADDLFKIQFTEALQGEHYYGVAAGNEMGFSDVVPTSTSIVVN